MAKKKTPIDPLDADTIRLLKKNRMYSKSTIEDLNMDQNEIVDYIVSRSNELIAANSVCNILIFDKMFDSDDDMKLLSMVDDTYSFVLNDDVIFNMIQDLTSNFNLTDNKTLAFYTVDNRELIQVAV